MKRVIYDRAGKAHPLPEFETDEEYDIRMASEGRNSPEPAETPSKKTTSQKHATTLSHVEQRAVRIERRKALLKEKQGSGLTVKQTYDRLGKRQARIRIRNADKNDDCSWQDR